jgi:hypothetical protein
MPDQASYRTVRLVIALCVGGLYFWLIGIGAVSERFAWNGRLNEYYGLPNHPAVRGSADVNGYYDLLGRAFVSGYLHLPVEPAPELLALPDPWSDQANRPYRLLDAALYGGHYYLYHGPTPALLLFSPWYRLTRHDFPENFAVFLFLCGGYLFVSALFTRMLWAFSIRLPLALYALFLATLGVGQPATFLLERAKVYEVAVAAGYFCVAAGFYFLFELLTDSSRAVLWGALSGLWFGLAIGCRPHLGVAAAGASVVLVLIWAFRTNASQPILRRNVPAFVIPLIFCGLAVAAYNYARFGSPLEFGTGYLLGGDLYRKFRLSGGVWRGLYYLLICPPDLVPEFPFFRLALRPLPGSHTLDPIYFLEPIAGVLALCPLLLLTPVLGWKIWRFERRVAGILAAMFFAAAGAILATAAVPFTSHRYGVDFAPYLLLIACVAAAARWQTWRTTLQRGILIAIVGVLSIYSVLANLALAIQGPYDQFVQARPRQYVQLARWFSPIGRFRPLLNPATRVRGFFWFSAPCSSQTEPLVSLGEFGSRYLLSARCLQNGQIRLISESSVRHPDVRTVDLPFAPPALYSVGLDFRPEDRVMTVTWNGQVVLRHPLRFLVTARSQIHFGWDPTLGNRDTFSGRVWSSPPQFFEVAQSYGKK